jgi:hypothetical protein
MTTLFCSRQPKVPVWSLLPGLATDFESGSQLERTPVLHFPPEDLLMNDPVPGLPSQPDVPAGDYIISALA